MNDNIFLKLEEYIKDNFSLLYINSRENFIGCKFSKIDKYYILYIYVRCNKLFLSVRKDVNYYYMKRYNIDNLSVEEIIERVANVLNESIMNKPTNILKSVRKSKNKKLLYYDEIEKCINNYKNLSLYDLILLPDVYQYLLDNNIVSIKQFLYYDLEIDKSISKSLKDRLESFKFYLISKEKLYFIRNYELLLMSRFKENFDEDDFDKYMDFGLCVGSLTMNLISNLSDSRNVKIFSDYMNLSTNNNFTLRELASIYNVSHGRIRDIINNILSKLKLHKGEYIILLKDIEKDEVLNYFIIGIFGIYNKNFLKFFLKLFDLDIYDNILYKIKIFRENLKLAKYISSENERELKVFNLINFSFNMIKNNKKVFKLFNQMRHVDSNSKFSGSIKLKKSKIKVEYESITERRILNMFDSFSFVKEIKTQSLVIPYITSGIECRYYPDIQILTNDNRIVIVEVKPLFYMMSKDSIFKYKLLKEYSCKYGYGYVFMDDRYNTFDTILNRKVSYELEEKFISYLKESRYLDYQLYRKFIKENSLDEKDIVNIVLKNQDKVEFNFRPFKFRYKR